MAHNYYSYAMRNNNLHPSDPILDSFLETVGVPMYAAQIIHSHQITTMRLQL